MPTDTPIPFDVAIIGGSYAGLSAALPLARARRRLLMIDAGIRRNRFATAAHGFLGQDGRAPDAIAADGRAQLLVYPTVEWYDGTATHATRDGDKFVVIMDSGARIHAKRLVLATGVVDELPEIDGLAERWGRGVFHCPYCHGYELNQGQLGVLATSPAAFHQAMLVPDWGTVTLFTNGAFTPDDAQRQELLARGVTIEPQRVVRVTDVATVELADGRRVVLDGLFTASHMRLSPLVEQLGCELEDGPAGAFIRTNGLKETTVPGVFACGDTARGAGSIALAVGDGTQAGTAAHRSLIFP